MGSGHVSTREPAEFKARIRIVEPGSDISSFSEFRKHGSDG